MIQYLKPNKHFWTDGDIYGEGPGRWVDKNASDEGDARTLQMAVRLRLLESF